MSKSSVNKPAHPAPSTTDEHEDDLIINPRGTSRGQFLFILGLMIFTLIIFTVGDSLTSSVAQSGADGGSPGLTWDNPELGKREVDQQQFIGLKRNLDDFYRVQQRNQRLSNDNVAVFMLLNELAQKAGIEITNKELATAIMQGSGRLGGTEPSPWSMRPMGDKATYTALLAQRGVTAPRFESTLRDVLRIGRYVTLVSQSASFPEPDEVLGAWKEAHQQYAYDYVEVSHEQFTEAATAELPTDEELTVWYDELPTRTQVFREETVQERTAAELIGLLAAGPEQAAGLLERYPPPADLEPDELALQYYNTVRTTRFRRETPLEEDAEQPDGTPVDPSTRIYYPLDEVKADALREAPVHKAMVTWLADLSTRAQDGAELDLATEASELGLFYTSDGVARTYEDWVELEGLGSNYLANAIRAASFQPTSLSAAVTTDASGLFIARTTEKVAAGLPPMADVRDRVVEEWTKQRASELALERLNELHATLASEAGVSLDDSEGAEEAIVVLDDAAFQRLVEAAGFTVGRRDWLTGFTTQTISFGEGQTFDIPVGPGKFDPQGDLPAHKFLSGNQRQVLESFEDGQVAAPALDDTKEHAYVARKVGQRDPAEIRMSRESFDELRTSEAERLRAEFEERYFSTENLTALYGLGGFWAEEPDEIDPES